MVEIPFTLFSMFRYFLIRLFLQKQYNYESRKPVIIRRNGTF